MSTLVIVVLAAVVAIPLLLAAIFKALWKVPKADEALIVTGFSVKSGPAWRVEYGPDGQPTAAGAANAKTFRIVTGGGAFVLPVLQKAQYLSLRADSADLEVTGVDKQKIPVGVKGVAVFKVGDGPIATPADESGSTGGRRDAQARARTAWATRRRGLGCRSLR